MDESDEVKIEEKLFLRWFWAKIWIINWIKFKINFIEKKLEFEMEENWIKCINEKILSEKGI